MLDPASGSKLHQTQPFSREIRRERKNKKASSFTWKKEVPEKLVKTQASGYSEFGGAEDIYTP